MGFVEGQYAPPPCFQCRDRCITYSWRCDGEPDCYYGEDEADCDYICPYETHHRCADTGYCIDNFRLCDGHYDCANGEDERNCYANSWVGNKRHNHDIDHNHDKLNSVISEGRNNANEDQIIDNANEDKLIKSERLGDEDKSSVDESRNIETEHAHEKRKDVSRVSEINGRFPIDRKEKINFNGFRNHYNNQTKIVEQLIYKRR